MSLKTAEQINAIWNGLREQEQDSEAIRQFRNVLADDPNDFMLEEEYSPFVESQRRKFEAQTGIEYLEKKDHVSRLEDLLKQHTLTSQQRIEKERELAELRTQLSEYERVKFLSTATLGEDHSQWRKDCSQYENPASDVVEKNISTTETTSPQETPGRIRAISDFDRFIGPWWTVAIEKAPKHRVPDATVLAMCKELDAKNYSVEHLPGSVIKEIRTHNRNNSQKAGHQSIQSWQEAFNHRAKVWRWNANPTNLRRTIRKAFSAAASKVSRSEVV